MGLLSSASKQGVKQAIDQATRSVMPAPQRFFDPEDKAFKPFLSEFDYEPGGRYLQMGPGGPQDITGQYPMSGNISVGPDGKPQFKVSEGLLEAPPDKKGAMVKTNLFKKKAGWKWTKAPKGYDPNPDSSFPLISVETKGKHYYALETDFPEGVDLARYPNSKSEPRLRPTRKGDVELGRKVGEISVRGKKHPVYDRATVRTVLPAAAVGAGLLAAPEESEAGVVSAAKQGAKAALDAGLLSPGIRAYHGSPHDFDRFSTDYPLTGEGANMYGQGLYFAESEDVARNYRDQLTKRDLDYEDFLMRKYKAAERKGDYERMQMYEDAMLHARPEELVARYADDPDLADAAKAVAKEITDYGPNLGRLYEVNIRADRKDFLKLDSPLEDQPDIVKRAYAKFAEQSPKGKNVYGDPESDYDHFRRFWESPRGAQIMKAEGVPGIEYGDAFTRHKPEEKQSKNFVIFDDQIIDIARKYGVTIPVAYAMFESNEAQAGQGSILLGAAKQGARIGQRYPTAVKATESPLDPSRVVDTQAIEAGGNLDKTVAAAVQNMPGLRTRARSTGGLLDAYKDQMADNLDFLYGQMPGNVVETAKNWYRGANQLASGLSNRYGATIEQAAGVLAALSPQKDWYQNVSLADRVFDSYEAGVRSGTALPDEKHAAKLKELYAKKEYADNVKAVLSRPFAELTDIQKAMWVRSHDQAFSDRGYDIISPTGQSMGPALTAKGDKATAAWGSNNEIAKAIRVIENGDIDNISMQMGEQHKVRNFYNNIVAPEYAREMPAIADVTMDTHAIAAGQLMPLSGSSPAVAANFGSGAPGSAVTGASGTYGINADAYRMAAEQAGIMPREMQSVTWEAVRNLYPAKWKNASNKAAIEGIWNDYSKGRISLDTARSLILEKAGGVDVPDWAAGRSPANDARPATPVRQSNLLEPSVPRESPNGVDGRARGKSASPAAVGLGAGLLAAQQKPTLADYGAGILDAAANAGSAMIAPIANAPHTLIQSLTSSRPTSQIDRASQARLAAMDYQPRTQIGQQLSDDGMRLLGGLLAPAMPIIEPITSLLGQLPRRAQLVGESLLDMSPL